MQNCSARGSFGVLSDGAEASPKLLELVFFTVWGGFSEILPALSRHLFWVDSPVRKSPSGGTIKPPARRGNVFIKDGPQRGPRALRD